MEEWSTIVDLARVAREFMLSARALTTLPRLERKLDACEARFTSSWQEALQALRGASVDTRQLLTVDMALRRLPADVSEIVFRFVVGLPIEVDGAPRRKRRRIA